jgi:hypothetical protein
MTTAPTKTKRCWLWRHDWAPWRRVPALVRDRIGGLAIDPQREVTIQERICRRCELSQTRPW